MIRFNSFISVSGLKNTSFLLQHVAQKEAFTSYLSMSNMLLLIVH